MSFAVMNASREFVLIESDLNVKQVTVGAINSDAPLPPSTKRFDTPDAVDDFMQNWRWKDWFINRFGDWVPVPVGALYETRPYLVGFSIKSDGLKL